MQLTLHTASVLLAYSALVAAVPAAIPQPSAVTSTDTVHTLHSETHVHERFSNGEIFVRAVTCNAVKPTTDRKKLDLYNLKFREMKAATSKAHEGEDMCKDKEWAAANKTKRATIKSNCIKGYTQCIPERKKANAACVAAGGTLDAGHIKAVTFCEKRLQQWKDQVV